MENIYTDPNELKASPMCSNMAKDAIRLRLITIPISTRFRR
jgi:hypothetical protein